MTAALVTLLVATGHAVGTDETPRRDAAHGSEAPERPEPVRSASFDRPPQPPSPGTAAAEALRIRAQLRRVERRLRRDPPAGLTQRQRRNRARALDRLREYRTRGLFPVNTDYPGRRVPYFVDRRGTLCALAYLVWSSGHESLVASVAARRNNAYVGQLASSPRIREWLREHGLTTAEAAMIQPAYDSEPGLTVTDPVDTGFVIASAVGAGLSAWTGTLSAADVGGGADSDLAGGAGLLSGGATAVLGATRLDTEGASLAIGIVDAAVGTAAAALGTANLLGGGPSDEASGRRAARGQDGPALSLRPFARTASGPRPGVGVTLHF